MCHEYPDMDEAESIETRGWRDINFGGTISTKNGQSIDTAIKFGDQYLTLIDEPPKNLVSFIQHV